uniref:Uncharacterized protein n=1 Tax=Panagrolaimus superbus TaxID=310955 RepID=A0A914YRX3_9BILA
MVSPAEHNIQSNLRKKMKELRNLNGNAKYTIKNNQICTYDPHNQEQSRIIIDDPVNTVAATFYQNHSFRKQHPSSVTEATMDIAFA